jgi:hypothetical protein
MAIEIPHANRIGAGRELFAISQTPFDKSHVRPPRAVVIVIRTAPHGIESAARISAIPGK